jgi:flagellar basal-body rod modification protein FlgD
MTSAVTNNTSSSASGSAQTAASALGAGATSAADIQNTFLNLLVAQLQNQDPLNPMDASSMTDQLAQISTVQGIQTLNSTVQQLSGSYATSQAMQATSLIGQSVLSPGNSLNLANGSATGGFNLSAAADKVAVSVSSASGQVVYQTTMSNLGAGTQTFQWDGTTTAGTAAAPGQYTFSVSASSNGTSVTAAPLSLSTVTGVDGGANAAGGTTLNTTSGSVPWSQIQQVN